jgi:hypothetical protein
MSSNRSVKDEDILAGFASLHEAMANGFDRIGAEFRRELVDLRNDLSRQILDVRNDVSRLEHRMLRRFDDVDERLDNHETRIAALEART